MAEKQVRRKRPVQREQADRKHVDRNHVEDKPVKRPQASRRKNGKKRVVNKINNIVESLILVVLGLYLAYTVFGATKYEIKFPEITENIFVGIFLGLAVVRLALFLCGKHRVKFVLKRVGFSLLLAVLYFAVYKADGYVFLLTYGAISMCTIGMDYRKVLKTFLISVGSVYVLAILGALAGGIMNIIYAGSGEIRGCLGISYPTDFAAYCFYLILITWVAWKKMPDWLMPILCLVLLGVAHYSVSSTGTLCGVLLLLVTIYVWIDNRFGQDKIFFNGLDTIIKGVSIFVFPLFAILIFILVYKYGQGSGLAQKIDIWMTTRLDYSWRGYKEYGLTLFGSPIKQSGGLGINFNNNDYFFLDIAYVLILLRYGICMFVFTCLIWCHNTWKAVKKKDMRLVLVFAMIAFNALSEHHLFDAHYNIFLVMPFANYIPKIGKEDGEVRGIKAVALKMIDRIGLKRVLKRAKSKIKTIIITSLVYVLALSLMLPIIFSYMRTYIDVAGLFGGGEHALPVIFMLVGLVVYFVSLWLVIVCLSLCTTRKLRRERVKASAILFGIIVIGLGVFIAMNLAINRGADEEFAEVLEADADVLDYLVQNNKGKVVTDNIPVLYKRKVPGLSYTLLSGEDLARFKNITVVMDRDTNYISFTNRGFLYAEISDYSAVYTNDQKVIEELEQMGIRTTGYYSSVNHVDLRAAAEENDLMYDEERQAVGVYGDDYTMKDGPHLALRGGKYTTSFTLHIDREKYMPGQRLCKLRVTADHEDEIRIDRRVFVEDFDINGDCVFDLTYQNREDLDIEFQVITKPDCEVWVSDISYQLTPDMDIHYQYNSRMLKSREVYYDLEGNPITGNSGQYACEFEYDRSKNNTEIRYYGVDDQLMINNAGYAIIDREFDNHKNIIGESYYDVDGNPIEIADGYASLVYERDKEGNVLEQRFYDAKGKPVITAKGYAAVHREYNDKKQVIKESYYGADNQLIDIPAGYAIEERAYDENGNVNHLSYLDSKSKRIMLESGYSAVAKVFDENKRVAREEFYDADDNKIMMPNNYWAIEYKYDGTGSVTVRKYFDTDNKPIIMNWGYAEIRFEYNSDRRVSRETYIGTDGEIMKMPSGFSIREYEYDAAGNTILDRFCDADGNLMITNDGYAMMYRSYNDKKQNTQIEFFDCDGNPIQNASGVAKIVREYGDDGQVSKEDRYDLEGNLIAQ